MRNQYVSRLDVWKYLIKYSDITKDEKKETLAWIKNGNTPYVNDRNILDESDHLLDSIGATLAKNRKERWQLRIGCEQ